MLAEARSGAKHYLAKLADRNVKLGMARKELDRLNDLQRRSWLMEGDASEASVVQKICRAQNCIYDLEEAARVTAGQVINLGKELDGSRSREDLLRKQLVQSGLELERAQEELDMMQAVKDIHAIKLLRCEIELKAVRTESERIWIVNECRQSNDMNRSVKVIKLERSARHMR